MRRYLMMKSKYLPLVLSGRKKVTLRRRTRLRPGDLFYLHSAGKVWAVGRVLDVRRIKLSEITPELADMEGISYEELVRELRRLYGGRDTPLWAIFFEILRVFPEPLDVEKGFYGEMRPRDIARLALEHGVLSGDEEATRILERLVKTDSIRKVALELGGLKKRSKVRAVLRKAYEELKKRGLT